VFILHSILPAWRGSLLPVQHAGQPPASYGTRFNVGIAPHPVGAKPRSRIPDGGMGRLVSRRKGERGAMARRHRSNAIIFECHYIKGPEYKGSGLNPLMRIKFGVRRVGYA
jgi:hypothetical protein